MFLSKIISILYLNGFTLRVHGFGGHLHNYASLLSFFLVINVVLRLVY